MSAFDTMRLESENARLRDLVRELAGVVKAVEWVWSDGSRLDYCPWCHNTKPGTQGKGNHSPDCPRQAALDKARGV